MTSYWRDAPYEEGLPTPDELLGAAQLTTETAYVQHLTAYVGLDWSILADLFDKAGEGRPEWLTAVLGKLDGIVDEFGELLVYLDANMSTAALASLVDVGDDIDLAADDGRPETAVGPDPTPPTPLRRVSTMPVPNYTGRPAHVPAAAGFDTRWTCVECHHDATNPVEHEVAWGHWPTYKHDRPHG